MPQQHQGEEFRRQADKPAPGLASDLVDFLRHGKRWWLTPLVIVFIIFGAFLALSAAGAPFIYTLF